METIESMHSYQAKGVLKSYFALNSFEPPLVANSANTLCVATYGRSGKISTSVIVGVLDLDSSNETFSYNYPNDFGMNAANSACRATAVNLRKRHQAVIQNLDQYMDLAHDFYRNGVSYAKTA